LWELIEGDFVLHVEIAKDAAEWNSIVERSPFSVLHHRYEVCVYEDKAIPLIVKVQKYRYLFPLKIMNVFVNFKVSFSPIYYYASLLPESDEAIDWASCGRWEWIICLLVPQPSCQEDMQVFWIRGLGGAKQVFKLFTLMCFPQRV
jgi:hypothetical protein